eukprot:1137192-Pelagomonas_calceolata.AAC.2
MKAQELKLGIFPEPTFQQKAGGIDPLCSLPNVKAVCAAGPQVCCKQNTSIEVYCCAREQSLQLDLLRVSTVATAKEYGIMYLAHLHKQEQCSYTVLDLLGEISWNGSSGFTISIQRANRGVRMVHSWPYFSVRIPNSNLAERAAAAAAAPTACCCCWRIRLQRPGRAARSGVT